MIFGIPRHHLVYTLTKQFCYSLQVYCSTDIVKQKSIIFLSRFSIKHLRTYVFAQTVPNYDPLLVIVTYSPGI